MKTKTKSEKRKDNKLTMAKDAINKEIKRKCEKATESSNERNHCYVLRAMS